MEELNATNENYTTLINEVNDIIKDIDSILDKSKISKSPNSNIKNKVLN